MSIKRIITSGSILTGIIIILLVLLVRSAIDRTNELQEIVDENVGTEIVINNDTLIVTNYVWWENLYMLNDGTKVSANLLDDLELIKP